MITCRCIKKFRDKQGKITGYRLVDTTGKTMDIESSELKQAIKSKQVEVENLTLTSDGRLIDKSLKIKLNIKKNKRKPVNIKLNLPQAQANSIKATANKKKPMKLKINLSQGALTTYINNLIATAKATGGSITNLRGGSIAIDMPHGKKLYIIVGNNATNTMDINAFMKNYSGNNYDVEVIGGQSLTSTAQMFKWCKFNNIDLSKFDTRNVEKMDQMFMGCEADNINLSSLDTRNVTNMSQMFDSCRVKQLDLSAFNTSQVADMSGMFSGCCVGFIDVSSFDTTNVKSMRGMFSKFTAPNLDLSNFVAGSRVDTTQMFNGHNVASQIVVNDQKIKNEI